MKSVLLPLFILLAASCTAQTRQDTLRGSNGRGRDWWDVQSYTIAVELSADKYPFFENFNGRIRVDFKVVKEPSDSMQIDLQGGGINGASLDGRQVQIKRDGKVFWVDVSNEKLETGTFHYLLLDYSVELREAQNPPWDGGRVSKRDSTGKPWIAYACQGLGASSWLPCKDYQADEPDSGLSITFLYPYEISRQGPFMRSNGEMISEKFLPKWNSVGSVYNQKPHSLADNIYKRFDQPYDLQTFIVRNPINLYNLTFYLGDYTTFTDTFHGEKGVLPLTFHPLRYNEAKARGHFAVVKDMLRCFEWWMGPYPFYEDGYKLVEAPYLGMEHQSAIAYGNKYQMGYLGRDRSGTGVGMLFDYIIIHESGHEWFGNNITAKDVADNWIHEGFTTYTETLYAEWIAGKEKAAQYNKGEWRNIDNDRPIIGAYGIHDDGSGDKYDKGAAMLHMIRTVVADDEKFRQILRGLNKDFWHQTVTTKQVEDYISQKSGYDFSAFFNQYLRTAQIPQLEWYRKGKRLFYRFTNVVPGFSLPVGVEGFSRKLTVTEAWNSVEMQRGVDWEDNFLMKVEKVRGGD